MKNQGKDSDELREEGNVYYATKNLEKALECYNKSLVLKSDPKTYGNRAQVLFQLGLFQDSLNDLEKSLDIEKNHVRRNRALGELEFSKLFDFSNNKVNKIIDENSYNLYVGPIEIVNFENIKGRGLQTTRIVSEGELLLIAKPLAYCIGEKSIGQDILADELFDNHIKLEKYLQELSDGKVEEGEEEEGKDISMIVKTNAFQITKSKFAVYHYPSFCNHSCAPNTSLTFYGNLLVLRAGRNLTLNEEITIRYFPTIDLSVSQRRKLSFNEWNFICQCNFCVMEEKIEKLGNFHIAVQPALNQCCNEFFSLMEQKNFEKSQRTNLKLKFDKIFQQIETFLLRECNISKPEELDYLRSLFVGGYQVRRAFCEVNNDVEDALKMQDILIRICYAIEPGSFEHCKSCMIAEKFALTAFKEQNESSRVKQIMSERRRVFHIRYGYHQTLLRNAFEQVEIAVQEASSDEWIMKM